MSTLKKTWARLEMLENGYHARDERSSLFCIAKLGLMLRYAGSVRQSQTL